MPKNKEQSKVKISFQVEPELKERLKAKVPWGDVTKIYTPITEQLVELMEDNDPALVKAGIISKKLPLSKIIDYNKEKEDET